MPRDRGIDKAWANMDPAAKEARKAQMRKYSADRAARLKAIHGEKIRVRKGLWVNKMRDYIDNAKVQAGQCVECLMPCEDWNTIMFAWDHIDPATKSFTLSKAEKTIRVANWHELIDIELAKCQLLCHNCHSLRTWLERHHDLKGIRRPGLQASQGGTTCGQPTLPLVQ